MSTRLSTSHQPAADELSWYSLLGLTLIAICATQFLISRRRLLKLRLRTILFRLKRMMPAAASLGLRTGGQDLYHLRPNEDQKETDKDSIADASPVLNTVLSIGRTASNSIIGRKVQPNAPKGLGNFDNSCYQNSVLQSLAALPSLQEYFLHVEHAFGAPSAETTLATLRLLADQLNDTSSQSTYHWTPAKLKSMSSWQQQDAQEYFSKLVEAIEKDMKHQMLKAKTEQEAVSTGSLCDALENQKGIFGAVSDARVGNTNDTRKSDESSPPPDLIMNPLDGLLAQRVGCTVCGHTEGLSLIPFNCLTLPLGKLSTYSLEQCLDDFSELEYIDGVECSKCTLLQAQRGLESLLRKLRDDETSETPESSKTIEAHSYIEKVEARLVAVKQALDDEDFAESTLTQKCNIPSRVRKTSQKSRQAVVARAPRCLVLHVNRSMFDEYTGDQLKNYAAVRYPRSLDLDPWTIGTGEESVPKRDSDESQQWRMDPLQSLIPGSKRRNGATAGPYSLKAVITHYGRHENGHYICYRQSPNQMPNAAEVTDDSQSGASTTSPDMWWRLSDEDVSSVTETEVMEQDGVFMLFYERDSPARPVNIASPLENGTAAKATEEGSDAAEIPKTPSKSDSTASVAVEDFDIPTQSHMSNGETAAPAPQSPVSSKERSNIAHFGSTSMKTANSPTENTTPFNGLPRLAMT